MTNVNTIKLDQNNNINNADLVNNDKLLTPAKKTLNDLNIVTSIEAIKQAAKELNLPPAGVSAAIDALLFSSSYPQRDWSYVKNLSSSLAIQNASDAGNFPTSEIELTKTILPNRINNLKNQLLEAINSEVTLTDAAAGLGEDLKEAIRE
jgi:hypothetical protein